MTDAKNAMETVHSKPKNIVLCSDGTGNSAIKDRGTNVFKLYEAVDIHGYRDDPSLPEQIAFYDDGVGTQTLLPLKLLGQAFGWGIARNVKDLYLELARVYDPGDKLFLFGFSRGAFTIRTLAGLIQCCGIPDRKRCATNAELKGLVEASYDEYRARYRTFWRRKEREKFKADDPQRRERLKAVQHEVHAPAGQVPIEFIGVWDTVDAVGMPWDRLADFWDAFVYPFRFHDRALTSQVLCARHAVSIDDERRTFRPVLWNEAGAQPGQIEQLWFAGVHANVGGGYPKQGMSLVALDWMVAEADARGLKFIESDQESFRAHRDVHDKLYDSRSGLGVYYRWEPRDINAICTAANAKVRIHDSVFDRIAHGTAGYAPGNIPASVEIGETRDAPQSARTAAIRDLLAQELGKLGAGSLLDTAQARPWIRIGRLSYDGFLALSIVALYFGLRDSMPPISLADPLGWIVTAASTLSNILGSADAVWQIAKKVALTWWFVPGMTLCYGAAALVDDMLDEHFSSFWHPLRPQLHT